MLDHYTTPGESIEIRDNQTIYSLLTDRLARTGADTVIAAKKIGPGRWQNVTTGEFHERVVSAAKGLIALGIAKGDAVTIFSSTRLEWGILDFALAAVGAVSVPIYDTDSAPQAQRIMNDSVVKLAFADNRERFDRLDSVKDHCPALKQILMIEGNALGALEGLGVTVSDEELNERVATVRADDLATIVYTSGSTGNPKGAELTHKNFVSITITASQALHEVVLDDHPRLLLFLPLAHCFARFIQYASIASDDGVVGYLPDTKSLLPDLRSFEPTYLLGVPRVFEKVYNAASHKAGAGWKGRLFVKAAEPRAFWSRKEQPAEQHTFARNGRARQVRNARLPHGARCSGPEDQVRGLRRRTTVARSGAFLQRHRTADDSGLWHDRNRRPVRRHARDRQCDRHRRPARARLLDSHFRRRRTAGQGPERVPRLPQSAGEDGRGVHRRRLAQDRRLGRDR